MHALFESFFGVKGERVKGTRGRGAGVRGPRAWGVNVKGAALTGPNFSKTIKKAFQIGDDTHVSYQLPLNMSKLVRFSETHTVSLARTREVRLGDDIIFEPRGWREMFYIDGGVWDYLEKTNLGQPVDVGTLSYEISLNRIEERLTLEEFIGLAYEQYAEGLDGYNRDYPHSTQAFSGTQAANNAFSSWSIAPPSDFERVTVSRTEYFRWTASEVEGIEYVYYALRTGDDTFLLFRFISTLHSTATATSTEPAGNHKQNILGDIEEIMSLVDIEYDFIWSF